MSDHAATKPQALVVAGPAGAGKSTFAELVAERRRGVIVVDKDHVTGPLVDAALRAAGHEDLDRENPYYKSHLSQACYEVTLRVAASVAAAGLVPVIVAPFEHLVDASHAVGCISRQLRVDGLLAVWLVADPETLRQRLAARDSPRDAGKLAEWDTFAERVGGLSAPGWTDVLVDTTTLTRRELAVVAWRLADSLADVALPASRGTLRRGPPDPLASGTVITIEGRSPCHPRSTSGGHEGPRGARDLGGHCRCP